jgi:rfaE bifunctional protein kinase chain/domain
MDLFKKLNGVSIMVVGDLILDSYLWGVVQRISPEAPVPIVEIGNETFAAGGAANVALNLASLGIKSEVFGVIGRDKSGRRLLEILAGASVKIENVIQKTYVDPISKSRVMAQGQQVCRLDREAKSKQYELASAEIDFLTERAMNHDAVIISDYAKGVVSQELIQSLRKASEKKSMFLAVDPKPKRVLDLSGMDLITPNRKEAVELAGNIDGNTNLPLDLVCKRIQDKYNPNYLAVTLSEEGILMCPRGGKNQRFPTSVQEVADVSGAGDTVVAVLPAAFCAGIDANKAAMIANIAAGIVVGKLGTASVTRRELNLELNKSV